MWGYFKKTGVIISLLAVILVCASCSVPSAVVALPVLEDYENDITVNEKKHLLVGASSAVYARLFLEAIQPVLEKKGYTAEVTIYNDYVKPNLALANGDIDLNIFQHLIYLNDFKFEYDLAISPITEIPTVSMGIYSGKYSTLADLQPESSVSMPGDTTNLSRALTVLESAGLITLNPYTDKSNVTEKDVINNPRNLQFAYMDAHLLVESLAEYDISVINGGFAVDGGLNPSDALYREILGVDYINVIAVRTEDLVEQFVRDIIDAVKSEEFRSIITDADGNFSGFQLPR